MIDEPEEEVGITRREKAKAKQEPVIKGMLPETPAPKPAERPQPVARRRCRRRRGRARLPVSRSAAPERAGRRRLLRVGQGLFGVPADAPGAGAEGAPAPAATPGEAPRRDRGDHGDRGDRGDR